MKNFKIFFYKYYEESKKFKTDFVIITAWGKEQAVRKFKDLGLDYDEFTIEEILN